MSGIALVDCDVGDIDFRQVSGIKTLTHSIVDCDVGDIGL